MRPIFAEKSQRRQFVPVAACSIAFVVALGLKWKRIDLDAADKVNEVHP